MERTVSGIKGMNNVCDRINKKNRYMYYEVPYYKRSQAYEKIRWSIQVAQFKNTMNRKLDSAFENARRDLLCVRK